jgi:hypothetical protein
MRFMNKTQALMNGMSAEWQRERAVTQMTLGKLIERLETLPPETMIALANPHSYRGHYTDLAFEARDKITVMNALQMCRSAMGEVFEGYKGGHYQMGRSTPVWCASYGCCGRKIMVILDDGTIKLADD